MSTVHAHPAKRFFVEMLIRDIELKDSILDLLDNCIDGAMREIARTGILNEDKPYDGYWARLTIDQDKFIIDDNCGGISKKLAENYAFRMGRPADRDPEDLPTVGVYGIGMKRAIFKMGLSSEVKSWTANEKFSVKITPEWLVDDQNWNLELDENLVDRGYFGSEITVKNLRDGVSRLFSDETDFFRELVREIGNYYGFIIRRGFKVYLNDQEIAAQNPNVVVDYDALKSGSGIAPYLYHHEHDGVSVTVAVGFYREPIQGSEEDDILEGKSTSEKAGWTVICNDRVVLYADKSRMTGWGEAGVPQYHTQFINISGVVVFKSNDASKLPLTTTKRGIDGNSNFYLAVKDFMRDGLKTFTNYTNKLKKFGGQAASVTQNSTIVSSVDLAMNIPADVKWVVSRKGGHFFKPNLPVVVENDPKRQIKFSKPLSEIAAVAEYFFDDRDIPPSDVGEKCFDYILKRIG